MIACAHCGRRVDGYAAIGDAPVCHPDADDRPDCYRLVTVYREPLGARRDPDFRPADDSRPPF